VLDGCILAVVYCILITNAGNVKLIYRSVGTVAKLYWIWYVYYKLKVVKENSF
jgi:hypothetical protein